MRAEQTDAELLEQVRAGQAEAFAELWRRHAGAALSVARGFTGLDAEDIVSESYERLFVALREGKGPRGAFRPYLVATVRNTGRQHYNRRTVRREDGIDDDSLVDPDADGEQVAILASEHRAALVAFESLPARWQEVLWYSQIDELPPREIAQRLGLRANAVSALALRAKRAFRDAWLSSQLTQIDDPACRSTVSQLGAYTRNGLSPRDRAKADAHLATCETCQAALAEARLIARDLSLVVLPAVAGTVGATHYLSTMTAPGPPAAFATPATPLETTTSGRQATGSSSRRALLIGGAVVVLVGAGVAASGPMPWTRPESPIAATAPPAPAQPVPSAAASDAIRLAATPTPTVSAPQPTASSLPTAAAPAEGAESGTALVPTAMPSVAPSASPDERPSPPTHSPETVPAAPDVQLRQSDARVYPWLTGAHAEPGATLYVRDADGREVGRTIADAFGDWVLHLTGIDPGSNAVSVAQTVRGMSSPSTAPVSFTIVDPPLPLTPVSGDEVDGTRTRFQLAAPAGTVIQRRLASDAPVQTLRIPASATWNEYLSLPKGTQVVALRYADARGVEFGPWSETVLDVR